MFDATVYDHTLEEHIDTLTQEATWLNISPEKREECFVSFAAFMVLDGNVQHALLSWQSLLCCEGTIVYEKKNPRKAVLVFHVTPHAILGRVCTVEYVDGHKVFEVLKQGLQEDPTWKVVPIYDYTAYNCCRVRLLAPYESHEKRPTGCHVTPIPLVWNSKTCLIKFKYKNKKKTLLRSAASAVVTLMVSICWIHYFYMKKQNRRDRE